MKKTSLLSLFFVLTTYTFAQTDRPTVNLQIKQITEAIKVDGHLNESIWEKTEVATNFWKQAPVDGEKANRQTEVRMAYDDKFMYLAATLWDDPDYIIQTLKRDNFGDSDAFAVVIDPVNQQTNAYAFAVNAKGAQSELLISPSGAGFDGNSLDESWDNKWFVAVQNESDRWTVEMAIPWTKVGIINGLLQCKMNRIDGQSKWRFLLKHYASKRT